MKHMTDDRKHRRTRNVSFNPNHEFVAEAVEEFLNSGGKIKMLAAEEVDLRESWIKIEDNHEADEFLQEQK